MALLIASILLRATTLCLEQLLGVVGGCWYQQADGSYAVNEDGLVAETSTGSAVRPQTST